MKNQTLTAFIALLLLVHFANAQTITTVVGDGVVGFTGDGGPPTAAQISSVNALCFGGSGSTYGSLYLVDQVNERIREVKIGGIIRSIAGNGSESFCGDSTLATSACIAWPGGVANDRFGNVFIGDYNNNRIRKVDHFGIITTYAGTGSVGFSGDNGQATDAMFSSPYNVVADKNGNIFVADQYNHRIRKIDTSGIITTIAGTGTPGWTGDGGLATNARISYPNYVHIDTFGALYISDNGNHIIRKVGADGIIRTIAGTGVGGYNGDGIVATNAQLLYPGGATVDNYGNVIICDGYNNRMRRVDAITGLISTIAGTGTAAFSGDNGPATAAEIDKPLDVAVDMQNNIYFGDYNNNRIRKISAVTTNTTSMQKLNPVIDVYPNPSNGIINIQWSHLESSDSKIEITDVLGRIVYQKGIVIDPTNNKIKIELTNFENGIYWLKLNANGVSYNHCITILK